MSACSAFQKEGGTYKGQIIFSQMEGKNLKLTFRKNDCSGNQQKGEEVVIVHKYDSTLVVGACVLVSDNGNTKNISTFSPRNPL
ncbi:TPA: glucose-6-phosphate isomerase [Haemophilus influenzae]|uniref:glucose-6-phosphate isomerase n=1 Tax=Haemophilus influenzae TaxID=727 RepID=UPI000CFF314A|nr:glucose-6-phosphate isomerase [Haemophilus influenzae]MCK9064488.1 glucose-6-phosphate isomerase [Haemophilus influenzae]